VRFQEITALALNANYVGSDWFDRYPSLRFPTGVITRSELFNKIMEQYGQSYEFKAAESDKDEVVTTSEPETAFADDLPKDLQGLEEQLTLRTTRDHVELDEVMVEKDSIAKSIGHDTIEWLTEIYKTSRGFELGTFDSSLLAMTMKTQSSKWEEIALAYISDVVSMAHTFILDLLRLVCPDARVRESIISILMDDLLAKYKAAFDSGRFLLRVERMGTPITLNHYFNDNLEKRFVTICCFPFVGRD